jgi:hypothetical protein
MSEAARTLARPQAAAAVAEYLAELAARRKSPVSSGKKLKSEHAA